MAANPVEVAQGVYDLLTTLFLKLDDCDRLFFGEYGVSTRQFWALHYLNEAEMSMVDLSRRLLTDKSNVTTIIDRLEQQGYVQRTPARTDRRMVLLCITPAGRAFHDRIFAAHGERIREVLGTDPATLTQLQTMLAPIQANLETYLQRMSSVQNGNGA